jgi:DnaJ family protein A protein 5
MGAQQSSGRDNTQNGAPVKTCYYEVLGIDRHATDDEWVDYFPSRAPGLTSSRIKKAYRKKALELHPDRNYGNVESATAKFAEVSSAYEVLSDPQERAWYDSHRESILRGDSGAGEEEHYEHSVRLTSAGDIVNLISRFNSSVPFTDAPNGFYGILRETFANLAREEDSACDWEGLEATDYPDFGESADDYEDVVRPFYKVWMNFSTKKTFSWRDAYRASDAPDRATRRLVEKENKRLRDEGIREFNDVVRSLVAFVRKRDPRYTPNSQSEADRQKILREAAAAQAARSRAANQAKFNEHVVPDWAQTQEQAEEDPFTESEEEEVEHIECVVCNKTFKSEKQYETHEKSKKHVKAVQQLQKEMRKENKALNLDTPSASGTATPDTELEKLDLDAEGSPKHDDPISIDEYDESEIVDDASKVQSQEQKPAKSTEPVVDATEALSESSDLDDEYASRQEVENRLASSLNEDTPKESNDSTATPLASDGEDTKQQKIGKAKAKRAKKAAKQEKAVQESLEVSLHEVSCVKSY